MKAKIMLLFSFSLKGSKLEVFWEQQVKCDRSFVLKVIKEQQVKCSQNFVVIKVLRLKFGKFGSKDVASCYPMKVF